MDSNILNLFDEIDKIYEKDSNTRKKIRSLCESGNYDQAQKIVDNEYPSIAKELLESRSRLFEALKLRKCN
ncbi:hypothetical protein AYO45_05550 [Gammaproteobacteria bacterium SCGC AG-212-F23]|nr:hypothetical protein AYO45_05550 [Gammaproteobacteria bacterium SCGC AG-212-F23]